LISRPIFLNLGVIVVFLFALGIGGAVIGDVDSDGMDMFPLSFEETCERDKGKGFVWEIATGNHNHTEDLCAWEEPEMDLPISALMMGNNTGGSATKGWAQEGIASWYGDNFHEGPTASGETYDMYTLTAAHRELPFDTIVEVTRLDNNDSVVVRINNRGPYIEGRIIDLSKKAADELGMKGQGLAKVRIEVIEAP